MVERKPRRSDQRTFITVHDGMPDHPKIASLSDGAFRLLVTGWCWCSRYLTDGVMPMEAWSRFGSRRHRDELIGAACVHVSDDHKSVSFHNYLEHQRSRQEVEDLRRKRSESGSKGGKARSKSLASAKASATPNAQSDATPLAQQTASRVQSTDVVPSELPSLSAVPSDEETRDDVDRICATLQERMVANGVKRPTITKAWHREARLLLDKDGYSFDEVMRVLEWSQADRFWKANIHSVPKFREKFGQLLIKSREQNARPARNPTRFSEGDRKGGMAWEM